MPAWSGPCITTSLIPYRTMRLDPGGIEPRRFLTSCNIAAVREAYPTSVGARVFIAGYFIILFRNRREMQHACDNGWSYRVGGLRPGADIVDFRP